MSQEIWKPFKQGVVWIGIIVGITAGLFALQKFFARVGYLLGYSSINRRQSFPFSTALKSSR